MRSTYFLPAYLLTYLPTYLPDILKVAFLLCYDVLRMASFSISIAVELVFVYLRTES